MPELMELHGPITLSWIWWAVAGTLVAVGVAILVTALRRLPRTSEAVDDSLEQLRADTLSRIDELADSQWAELSRTVRRFVGLASDSDADYLTAGGLAAAARRDPRLIPVAEFASIIQGVQFSPGGTANAAELRARAKEVVTRWR